MRMQQTAVTFETSTSTLMIYRTLTALNAVPVHMQCVPCILSNQICFPFSRYSLVVYVKYDHDLLPLIET